VSAWLITSMSLPVASAMGRLVVRVALADGSLWIALAATLTVTALATLSVCRSAWRRRSPS
jgi:hypothetical protein